MLNLISIKNWFTNQGKFRFTPPVAISMLLSTMPHLGGETYLQWAGIQSISILSNWLVGLVLAIGTLAYFAVVYEKEWFGISYKSKRRAYFRIFSFAFLGLAATLCPFYLGVGNYIFSAVDIMTGSQNSQQILYLMAWTFGLSFMLTDMFRSLDGKSGIIYKMPPLNKSPMKNYSSMDYKLKKFFKL